MTDKTEPSGSSEDTIETEEVKLMNESRVEPKPQKRKPAARAKRVPKVSIRSLWPSKLIILAGDVPSGKRYVFERGGDIQPVEPEDVGVLLARRRKAGCCGSGRAEQSFFELAA